MVSIKENIISSNDSGILFNTYSGDNYQLNKVGLELFNLLKEGKSLLEMVEYLTKKYRIDDCNAKSDIMDFIALLKTYDLVDNE